MAYEVTKRIKGRDYRYRVESAPNPDTGRAGSRWVYLGKVERGVVVAPARSRQSRVTHDEIVATTAKLLETRDASRVTVAVIAQFAGISAGTFYRHFSDRDAAFSAALALLTDTALQGLPPLEAPIGTRDAERARLDGWFRGLHRAVLQGRAFRWILTTTGRDKLFESVRRAERRIDPQVLLSDYFRALNAAGVAHIDDPDGLARGLMTVHGSVARDIALHDDADAAQRWSDIFPVIERAVFC
jgi:AcrR family transcriptional regulator